MKPYYIRRELLTLFILIFVSILPAPAQETAGPTVTVRMTVTAAGLSEERVPDITSNNVTVRQRGDTLQVTKWEPARGGCSGSLIYPSSSMTLPIRAWDRSLTNYAPLLMLNHRLPELVWAICVMLQRKLHRTHSGPCSGRQRLAITFA